MHSLDHTYLHPHRLCQLSHMPCSRQGDFDYSSPDSLDGVPAHCSVGCQFVTAFCHGFDVASGFGGLQIVAY